MKEWAIWLSFLAFILVEDRNKQEAWKLEAKDLFRLIYEGALLFAGAGFLMLTYYLTIAIWQPLERKAEFQILFTFLGAYILQSVLKKKDGFGISLLILAIWTSAVLPENGIRAQLFMLSKMIFGIICFSIGLIGFKDKLLLMDLPPVLQGLPITFLLMALMTLAFLGAQFIA